MQQSVCGVTEQQGSNLHKSELRRQPVKLHLFNSSPSQGIQMVSEVQFCVHHHKNKVPEDIYWPPSFSSASWQGYSHLYVFSQSIAIALC